MTRPPPTAAAGPPADLPSSDAAMCFEIYPAPGGTADAPTTLAALRSTVLTAVNAAGAADHAWHVDSFESSLTASTDVEPPWRRRGPATAASTTRPPVFAAPPNTGDGGPCLWGRLTYGDAVADEWLAAWLLRHVTAALPAGVAARAWDEEDGEFLLIEAAPGLPRWVSPDLAADRVWFCGGALHLVPPPAAGAAGGGPKRRLPPGAPAQPSAAEALAFVRDPAARTAAGPRVAAALAPRLDGAPAAAARGVHRARVTLPARLAAALATEPGLVAPATAAFVAASAAERRRGIGSGGADAQQALPAPPLATVVVRFSRLQYAQYALAPALPPPPSWPPLPPGAPAEAAAARELGAKVTAAFACLLASTAGLAGDDGQGGPPADPAVLAALPEWRAVLAALTARGAFDGEVEGSARSRALAAAAAAEFAASPVGRAAAARRAAPAARVRAALAGPPPDVAALEAAASAGPPADADDWMADGGAALDAEVDALEARAAAEAKGTAPSSRRHMGAPSSASPFDPSAVVAQVKAFVEGMSSFEGAAAPPAPTTTGCDPADASQQPGGEGDDSGPLSLDGTDFWRELGACLGVAPDELFGGGGEGGGGTGGAGAAAINALFGSDVDDDDDDDEEDYATSEDEGSSFYDGPSDDDDDDDEAESPSDDDGGGRGGRPPKQKSAAAALASERSRLAALERGRGASLRAGPPPEAEEGGGGPGFGPAYAAALDAQLAETTLAATFADEVGGGGGGGGAPAAPGPIVPVDVDANLVACLLASHAGVGGGGGGGARAADLPGPAAGLAAMLGVRLPAPPAPAAVAAPVAEPPRAGLAPAPAPPDTPNTSRG